MITIARFSKPEEAHLLRLRLEAGGVPAYIQDENMVQMDWLYSNAIGGVRVQISEEDIDSARAILDEPPIPETPGDLPACPKCASHETEIDELPRRIAFLSLLIPFLFSRRRLRCSSCRHTWHPPRQTEQDAAP